VSPVDREPGSALGEAPRPGDEAAASRPIRMSFAAIALQFAVYPLLVAGGCVLAVGLIWWATHDTRTAADLLEVVEGSTGRQRWRAAHDFAGRVATQPELRTNPVLGRHVLSLFVATRDDDPRVAGYLAHVLAVMAPEGAAGALLASVDSRDASLRLRVALGLAEIGSEDHTPALAPLLADPDAGVRKAASFAVGRLGGECATRLLAPLLRDPEPDVRWNAALGLANLGSGDGLDVLLRMLDRSYVRDVSVRARGPGARGLTGQQLSDVTINAVRAAARLRLLEFREPLQRLWDHDPDAGIQEAARLALHSIDGD